jgi:hypothetical protein
MSESRIPPQEMQMRKLKAKGAFDNAGGAIAVVVDGRYSHLVHDPETDQLLPDTYEEVAHFPIDEIPAPRLRIITTPKKTR